MNLCIQAHHHLTAQRAKLYNGWIVELANDVDFLGDQSRLLVYYHKELPSEVLHSFPLLTSHSLRRFQEDQERLYQKLKQGGGETTTMSH